MLSSSSSCCCAEATVASPPRAARVVAPVRAAPLRNDRLEEPDWLSSGEGMTSISFGVFIALRLLFRFLESHPLLMSGVGRGRGRLSRLDRVRPSICDGFDRQRLFSEELPGGRRGDEYRVIESRTNKGGCMALSFVTDILPLFQDEDIDYMKPM